MNYHIHIAGSAPGQDSSQKLGLLDWLLQGQETSKPCLRVHGWGKPTGPSHRLVNFAPRTSWCVIINSVFK
jgi:hypothetical protein